MEATSGATNNPKRFALLAGALFAVGLALRFYQLGDFEFWLDEALTGYLSYSDNWLHFVHNSPPLYFYLARLFASMFGVDEFSLRALSVLSSGLLIPLSMYTARSMHSSYAGIAAGLFVLVSPINVYYAQEARPYALLVTEIMLVIWTLWATSFQPRRAAWVLLLGGTVAAIYTHTLAFIPIGIGYLLAMSYAMYTRHWARLRLYVTVGAISVVCYLPWFFWWINTTDFNPKDMEWLEVFWLNAAKWRLPFDSVMSFHSFSDFLGGNVVGKQFLEQSLPLGLSVLSIIAVTTVIVVNVHCTVHNQYTRPAILALLILLLAPLLTLLAISFIRPIYLPGRYDLIAFPAFVLLFGIGVAHLRNRLSSQHKEAAVLLLLAALLLPSAARLQQFYESDGNDKNRSVARYLAENVGEGDLVIMEEARGIRTVYYLRLFGYDWEDGVCTGRSDARSFACRFVPLGMESAPAAITRHWRATRKGLLGEDVVRITEEGTYANIYLLPKNVNRNDGRVTVNKSIEGGIQRLQGIGYRLAEVRSKLEILRFHTP